MKFGIPNTGFNRIIARLKGIATKEAAEYTDDWEESWEDEYGEDWSEPTYTEPEPLLEVPQDISPEDFIKGEFILAAMGYDVENMSDEEILQILRKNPEYLQLVPQFNVQGQWVHTMRATSTADIKKEVPQILSSEREICVTSGDAAEFWNFSNYRLYAIVLEGPCKVLWNADMYSHLDPEQGKLLKTAPAITFLNEMTEGWLVPAECQFVGLKVNWHGLYQNYINEGSKFDQEGWQNAGQLVMQMAEELGVPILDTEKLDKMLIGLEVMDAEDAAQYEACDIDPTSPEHLYEPYDEESEEAGTYMDMYTGALNGMIETGDFEEAQKLLDMGVSPDLQYGEVIALSEALAKPETPFEFFQQIIDNVVQQGEEAVGNLFPTQMKALLDAGAMDKAEYLLNASPWAPSDYDYDIWESASKEHIPFEFFQQIFSPYAKTLGANKIMRGLSNETPQPIVDLVTKNLYRPLDFDEFETMILYNDNRELVKKIEQAVPGMLKGAIQDYREAAAWSRTQTEIETNIQTLLKELRQ